MKKVVTLDAIMVSFISAMGYGFGYAVPSAFNFHPIVSIIICFALGIIAETIAEKIIFSSYVQKSEKKRYAVFACVILMFLAGYSLLSKYFAYSLWEDVGEELTFSVVIPIATFLATMAINAIKRKKLLEKYGTGESGFIVDKESEQVLQPFMDDNKEITNYSGKDPAVKTYGGTFIGKKSKNGVSFLGIPYAKAPVGENRWKRPLPVDATDKTFEAYYFGASEIQPDSTHNILAKAKQDEDCLNLNIWTAKLEPNVSKPVFVYIHGGDGRCGGSVHPLYHLDNLAKNIPDAVFVSINYRFGVFGTVAFDSSVCSDADMYEESTTLSLLDQIEALKWIKANISAFGGNPENITVAGDSAGGSCIEMLAAVKEAKGLFRRALIICSSLNDTPIGNVKASLLGKLLLEEFHAKSVSEMKAVQSEQLKNFSNNHYDLLELPPRDGRLVPQDVDSEYQKGAASDVEFIFGIAADDISTWQAMLAGDVSLDDLVEMYYAELADFVGAKKADKLDALLLKYQQSGLSVSEAKRSLLADFQYKASVLHDCRTLAKSGSKVRCFYWDVKGNIDKLTANTVSIVTTILGNDRIAEQMGYLNDQNLTEIMQAFVGKFINGKPMEFFKNELKGVQKIDWQEFNTNKDSILLINGKEIKMTENAFTDDIRELEKILFEE